MTSAGGADAPPTKDLKPEVRGQSQKQQAKDQGPRTEGHWEPSFPIARLRRRFDKLPFDKLRDTEPGRGVKALSRAEGQPIENAVLAETWGQKYEDKRQFLIFLPRIFLPIVCCSNDKRHVNIALLTRLAACSIQPA